MENLEQTLTRVMTVNYPRLKIQSANLDVSLKLGAVFHISLNNFENTLFNFINSFITDIFTAILTLQEESRLTSDFFSCRLNFNNHSIFDISWNSLEDFPAEIFKTGDQFKILRAEGGEYPIYNF